MSRHQTPARTGSRQPRIAVIGAGVIGMATAAVLAELACQVDVLASDRYRRTTDVAASFWFPFACDFDADDPHEEQRLAEPTLDLLLSLVGVRDAGVSLPEAEQYFDTTVDSHSREPHWFADRAAFRPMREADLPAGNDDVGHFDGGWHFRVPVVHPPTFLRWLRRRFAALAGPDRVFDFDVQRIDDLARIGASSGGAYDAVVNCTGGWAGRLVGNGRVPPETALSGIQGVVVRVADLEHRLAGDKLVLVEHGRCEDRPVYIVPHAQHATVLGGTLKSVVGPIWPTDRPDQWTPSEADINQVITRCSALRPTLMQLLSWSPLDGCNDPVDGGQKVGSGHIAATAVAGLRPKIRNASPRVRLVDCDFDAEGRPVNYRLPVIHNYGHGGAGVTLCWGSALRVADLLVQTGIVSPPRVPLGGYDLTRG